MYIDIGCVEGLVPVSTPILELGNSFLWRSDVLVPSKMKRSTVTCPFRHHQRSAGLTTRLPQRSCGEFGNVLLQMVFLLKLPVGLPFDW